MRKAKKQQRRHATTARTRSNLQYRANSKKTRGLVRPSSKLEGRQNSSKATSNYRGNKSASKTPKTAFSVESVRGKLKGVLWGLLAAAVVFSYIRVPGVSTEVYFDPSSNLSEEEQLVDESFLASIEQSASDRISGWWGSYSLFDRERLKEDLLKDFSEISSVKSVKKNFFGSVLLTIEPRIPVVIYESGQKQYYIGEDGAVFSGSLLPSEGDFPKLASNISASNFSEGDLIISRESAEFISRFKQVTIDASQDTLQIDRFELSPNLRELVMFLQGESYEIKLRTDSSPSVAARSLVDVVNFFDKESKKPTLYVDLRLEGEAVYR